MWEGSKMESMYVRKTTKPIIGSVLLIVSGLIGIFSGFVLINLLDPYYGNFFTVCSIWYIISGLIRIGGGILAIKRKSWGTSLVCGIISIFNIGSGGFLALIGVILIGISKKEFITAGYPTQPVPSYAPSVGYTQQLLQPPPPPLGYAPAKGYWPVAQQPQPPATSEATKEESYDKTVSAVTCHICGAPIETDSKFCDSCGAKLKVELAEEIPTAKEMPKKEEEIIKKEVEEKEITPPRPTATPVPEEFVNYINKVQSWKSLGFDVSNLEKLLENRNFDKFKEEYEILKTQIEG